MSNQQHPLHTPLTHHSLAKAGLVALLLAFGQAAVAADWYVDNAASGTAQGTSWADAWTSFGAIKWTAIAPGDTLHFSGGVAGKTYNEKLTVGKSGLPGNPITIRCGQTAGHNGRVAIHGGINLASSTWVTLDGGLDGAINMSVTDPQGVGIYATKPIGLQVLYMEVYGSGDADNEHGIRFNPYNGLPDQTEIAFCHIHDNFVDGINIGNSKGLGHGEVRIHHNLIERNGDDGIQCAGGMDIYNNVIRDQRNDLGPGHPDGIQIAQHATYTRVYNNEIRNFSNAQLFPEQTGGHLFIYNNIFYLGQDYDASSTRGIDLNPSPTVAEMGEVLIANNTFVNFKDYVALRINGDFPAGTPVHVANNIFLNNRHHYWGNPAYTHDNLCYVTLDAACDNGGSPTLCGGSAPAGSIPADPRFVDHRTGDFRLRDGSPALDAGVAFNDYFNEDHTGLPRPQGGAWDIGAYEGTADAVSSGTAAAPSPTPAGGEFEGSVSVSLASATAGATIRYTTDGSTPNANAAVYTGPLTFTATTTLKAYAAKSGLQDSAVATTTFTRMLEQVAAPDVTPDGGLYGDTVTLSMSSTTPGATIHYTTDNSTPDSGDTVYTAPFSLATSATVKALAVKDGYLDSDVTSLDFQIGAQSEGDTVVRLVLIDAESDADITVLQSGARYSFVDLPTRNLNVRADTDPAIVGSVSFGLNDNASYIVENVAPYALAGDSGGNYDNWTPDAGTYTITATPYSSSGAKGEAGLALTVTFTLADEALEAVAAPVMTPAGGSFEPSVTIAMTSATAGATIHYTSDGSVPSASSPTYTAPLFFMQSVTIRAIAVKSGQPASAVVSAEFAVRPAPPLNLRINPEG